MSVQTLDELVRNIRKEFNTEPSTIAQTFCRTPATAHAYSQDQNVRQMILDFMLTNIEVVCGDKSK